MEAERPLPDLGKQRRSVVRPSVRRAAQGKAGMESYRQFESDRDRGDFEGLPELHATLSGMKASASLLSFPQHCLVLLYWDLVLPASWLRCQQARL